jgi:hypothetical protein
LFTFVLFFDVSLLWRTRLDDSVVVSVSVDLLRVTLFELFLEFPGCNGGCLSLYKAWCWGKRSQLGTFKDTYWSWAAFLEDMDLR